MNRRWGVGLIGFVLGAAACGSAGTAIETPETTEPAFASTTSTTTATDTTLASSSTSLSTTTTMPSTTTVPESFWIVEDLGPAMIGIGEFVVISDSRDDPDTECRGHWLGYRDDAGSVHRYEELGVLGHVRLFNGPRGQDAVVESCEESIESILIQGSAFVGPSGVPEFTPFPFGDMWLMNFFTDLGWRGDVFGATASNGSWDELVLFSTESSGIVEAHEILGARIARLNHGYDFVLPTGWTMDAVPAADPATRFSSPDGLATISIITLEFAGDPEPLEGADLLTFSQDPSWTWSAVDPPEVNRGRHEAIVEQSSWTFATEDRVQTITQHPGADNYLVLEVVIDRSASRSLISVADLAAELVRHFG